MAPFTAANHGALRSPAEDRVNQLLSLAAGVIVMATAIASTVALGVQRQIANLAAAAVMFGTNQFHFATYDSSFTHIYSAAIIGTIASLIIRSASRQIPMSRWEIGGVAIMCGLLVDIRMMLILPLALVGLVLATHEIARLGVRLAWRNRRALIISSAIACALALFQQMAVNRYIFGQWRLSAYAGEDFIWSQGKQLHVLFSIRKGALLWSPMIAVAMVAAIATRRWLSGAVLGVSVASLTIIYGAWHSWDLAGGFGHRGFVEVAPLCVIALGAAAARCNSPGRVTLLAISAFSVLVTLGLMRGYWIGQISFSGGTTGQYVSFGFGSESFLVHYVREILDF